MKLLFYGHCADWIGCREMSVSLVSSKPLMRVLESSPQLAPILKNKDCLLVSVNCALRAFDTSVQDEDEVAFLPPFGDG